MSESSSSDSELPAQAFPIPKSDTDEPPDPQKALTSPEEYIRFVRHEAESYPDIFYSPVTRQENESNAVDVPDDIPRPRTDFTEEEMAWITLFNESVEEYQFCKSILLEEPVQKERLTTQQLTDPSLLDGAPTLSWMATRCRIELDAVLELVASQCTRKRWKPSLCTWVFASLVALEKPIHPDTCHTLRTIAKRCQRLKQELGKSLSETESRLFNVYPYLIAKVFGQLDLLKG